MELYGTLGPACAREDTLTQMLELGMTGLRLNLSHVTLAGAAPWLEALEKAAARTGIRPALLIDMQGPEMRTGALKSPLPLREGERVALGPEGVPLPACVLTRLRPGRRGGRCCWTTGSSCSGRQAADRPSCSGEACCKAARASPCRTWTSACRPWRTRTGKISAWRRPPG